MKRKISFLLFILAGFLALCTYSCKKDESELTTLTFQDLANMSKARGAIAYASDNNRIYVSNGLSSTSQYTTEIEKYDIANNAWSVFSHSQVAKRFSTSVIVGNNLYIFGGNTSNGDAYNNKMEVVDLSNGSITFTTDNPVPAHVCGAATWNGSIYVFGGSIGSNIFSSKLYKFDTATSVWTELASMPESKETKGAIVNGKLYVFGGYNGAVSNRIDMYDIQTNVWISLGTMPDNVSGNAIAVNGNKIFIVGDYTNETYLASYDVNTGAFKVLQSNMIARRHAGAAVINGRLYVMGGNQSSSILSCLSSLQMAPLK